MNWLKQHKDEIQIALTVSVLIVTLASALKGGTSFVLDLTTSSQAQAEAVTKLVAQVEKLTRRVEELETANLQRDQLIAETFPRRTELEPRFKAIEDMSRETNMMVRRLYENQRR